MRRGTTFALNLPDQDLTVPGTYYSQAIKIASSNAFGAQIYSEGSSFTATMTLQVSYDPLEPIDGNPTPSSTMIGSEPLNWDDQPDVTPVTISGGGAPDIIDNIETTANWGRVKIEVTGGSSDLVITNARLGMKGYGIA